MLKAFHFILKNFENFSSVQFSRSVVSDYLRPHESQHARPPCPSPTPGVHSDSRPSSQWCHPAISSSVILFFCPQSLPASKSFPMSQLFPWGGQSTGVSALASFLPKKSQGWSQGRCDVSGFLQLLWQHLYWTDTSSLPGNSSGKWWARGKSMSIWGTDLIFWVEKKE